MAVRKSFGSKGSRFLIVRRRLSATSVHSVTSYEMRKTQKMTINTLTHKDIRDLLTGFAASIELDQIRVDALSPEKFHPEYSDSMWRNYRRDHLQFIDQLLPTVDTISPAL